MLDSAPQPIFVIGRQHSGNTLLVDLLGRNDAVLPMLNEGTLFEYTNQWRNISPGRLIEKVANSIGQSQSPRLERSEVVSIRNELNNRLANEADSPPPPAELYRLGMGYLCSQTDAGYWVQKATSYIFYVDRILEALPKARLVFLLRNPFDIAASLLKRSRRGKILRALLGWSRGVELADFYRQKYQQRFLIAKYENLIRNPEETIKRICSFCNIEFVSEMLSADRVNTSDSPYSGETGKGGFDEGRICYYTEVLSRAERRVVYSVTSSASLEAWYPDLIEQNCKQPFSAATLLTFIGEALADLAVDHGQRLFEAPGPTVRRIVRRLRS